MAIKRGVSVKKKEKLIEGFEPSRRAFIRKTVGAGFSVPVVSTFTMAGLMARPNLAQANLS